jgi:hypothetical protein
MKNRSLLHNLFTAALVACCAMMVVFLLGVDSIGSHPSKFEYRVINRYQLIENVGTQVRQQQQDMQKQTTDDIFRISAAMGTELSKQIENSLNELGAEGWELAGVSDEVLILKRPGK